MSGRSTHQQKRDMHIDIESHADALQASQPQGSSTGQFQADFHIGL